MLTDHNGVITLVNSAFLEIISYARNELIGKKPNIFKSHRHGNHFYQEMWQRLIKKAQWQGKIWNRRKDGSVHPVQVTITGIKNARGRVMRYASVYFDITHTKQNEQEIRYKTTYDALTTLANRLLFYDRLGQTIKGAKRSESSLAFLYKDSLLILLTRQLNIELCCISDFRMLKITTYSCR